MSTAVRYTRLLFTLVLLLFFPFGLYAVVKGSSTQQSIEPFFIFPASDADNRMAGFGWFKNGFGLENKDTACLFDSVYPVSGNVLLNGGTLELSQDLIFRIPLHFEVGSIVGNNFSIVLPHGPSTITFPQKSFVRDFTLIERIDIGSSIYSVGWSHDDRYLAVAAKASNSISELRIYAFDGKKLNLVAAYDTGSSTNIYTLSWHPLDYILAIGTSRGNTLKIFAFDPENNTLASIVEKSGKRINAVSWHPSGNYLAVGRYKEGNIELYPFENKILGDPIKEQLFNNLDTTVYVQENALAWTHDGAYLSVGLNNSTLSAEVQNFSCSSNGVLASAGSIETGGTVTGIAWHPLAPIFALGLSNKKQLCALYSFDTAYNEFSLLLNEDAQITAQTYGVAWTHDGTYLIIGSFVNLNQQELQVFHYDTEKNFLSTIFKYDVNDLILDVKCTHSQVIFAGGTSGGKCLVLGVGDSWVQSTIPVKDTSIYLNSGIILQTQIQCEGVCLLSGNGHSLDLDDVASIEILPNSTLILENVLLQGLRDEKIYCHDDSGVLVLRNVLWSQESDMHFNHGQMIIDNVVTMQGDTIFAYCSTCTFIINSHAMLELEAGFTFSFDSSNAHSNSCFCLTDNTTVFALSGATFCVASRDGLSIKNGQFEIRRDSIISDLSGLASKGITFGSRKVEEDLSCEIFSGVTLTIGAGTVHYANINPASWRMMGELSRLKVDKNAKLCLEENLILEKGMLAMEKDAELTRTPGKNIKGTIYALGNFSINQLEI